MQPKVMSVTRRLRRWAVVLAVLAGLSAQQAPAASSLPPGVDGFGTAAICHTGEEGPAVPPGDDARHGCCLACPAHVPPLAKDLPPRGVPEPPPPRTIRVRADQPRDAAPELHPFGPENPRAPPSAAA